MLRKKSTSIDSYATTFRIQTIRVQRTKSSESFACNVFTVHLTARHDFTASEFDSRPRLGFNCCTGRTIDAGCLEVSLNFGFDAVRADSLVDL